MLSAAYSPALVRKFAQDEQRTRRSTQRDQPPFMIVSQGDMGRRYCRLPRIE
jgi:hypothetical protein